MKIYGPFTGKEKLKETIIEEAHTSNLLDKNFKSASWDGWMAPLVGYATLHPGIVSLSPTWCIEII